MYNCEMCNTSFEDKVDFLAHPHIVQKKLPVREPHISEVRFSEQELAEPVIVLSLHDAAEQALWDLRQWVKDHPKPCECFTCCDSIPDLERALNPPAQFHGICC